MPLPTALCSAAYKSGSNRGCTVDFSSEKILGCVMRNVCVIVSMPANVIAFALEYTMLEIIWSRILHFSLGSAAEECFFLAAYEQIRQVLPCCLLSACGTRASSLGRCSSTAQELNQYLCIRSFFIPSVQHYNFSGFNNSDRSPQCPVAALLCETPFWQIQVLG